MFLSKALKLFLLGLCINPVLINVIGFINPFFAISVLDDVTKSRAILHAVQPYFPLVSIIYISAMFNLVKIDDRLWVKASSFFVALFYFCFSFYGLLNLSEFQYTLFNSAYYTLEVLMLFMACLVLLKYSKKLQSDNG